MALGIRTRAERARERAERKGRHHQSRGAAAAAARGHRLEASATAAGVSRDPPGEAGRQAGCPEPALHLGKRPGKQLRHLLAAPKCPRVSASELRGAAHS